MSVTSVAVSVRAVTRSYGTTTALREVTMSFPAGTRTAVVGRSGSGKSTLLHIVARLDTAHAGQVELSPPTPRIGYAFQEHRLLPWRSVAENVAFPLVAARWIRAAIDDRVAELLAAVGLSDVADDYPSSLSGGMRQRASLARALAARPALLLLDEPFSAVDEEQAEQLCLRVRAETVATGATLVLVTHRLREAALMADRAVLLHSGEVVRELSFPRIEPGEPEVDGAVEQLLRAAVRAGTAAEDRARR